MVWKEEQEAQERFNNTGSLGFFVALCLLGTPPYVGVFQKHIVELQLEVRDLVPL